MNIIPGRHEIRLEQLLNYVSQEEIFRLIFNFYPEEGELYSSPFRVDNTPGCYFRYSENGKLKFIDWGNPDDTILDCFEAVKIYYNFSSYIQVIHLLYDVFIEGKIPEEVKKITSSPRKPRARKKTKIAVHRQPFTEKDRKYWEQYGITEEELIEDKIFSIDKTYINSAKGEYIINSSTELSFADTSFISGNKKVYYPEKTKEHKRRFITNCNQNDIGNLQNIDFNLNYLIITKSHKDCRVLKNSNYKNTVYFSNEGQYPNNEELLKLVKSFPHIYIFFDNDSTGIKAAINLKNKISNLCLNKVTLVYINSLYKAKDISDLYKYYGKEICHNFIIQNFNVSPT